MMGLNFLFSPFWGKLNEQINSKTTMLICSIGYAVGQVLFWQANSQNSVIFARMFSGVFTGGSYVSFLTYVVNVTPPEKRGQNLTVLATVTRKFFPRKFGLKKSGAYLQKRKVLPWNCHPQPDVWSYSCVSGICPGFWAWDCPEYWL